MLLQMMQSTTLKKLKSSFKNWAWIQSFRFLIGVSFTIFGWFMTLKKCHYILLGDWRYLVMILEKELEISVEKLLSLRYFQFTQF